MQSITRDVLNEALSTAIAEIRSKIPNATGKTSRSLEAQVIEEANYGFTARLLGRPYLGTLETGRGPATGAETTNEGGFKQALAEWCKIRGFPETSLSDEQYQRAAARLAWYINKFGDKTYRSGQRKEIYSPALEKLTDTVERKLTAFFYVRVRDYISRGLDNFGK